VDRWIGINVTSHNVGRSGKEVRISVEDHGQGISDSELKHIFEPFYRSPRVVRAQVHGTGLGLALAKHVAESLGGRISVESKVGVGSTFTLHLLAANERTQGKRFTVSETTVGN
jgi:two-component system phosphate regulon sensor histidine kinase PhoR